MEIEGHEEDSLTDLLHKEVQKWMQHCVDVDALQRRVAHAEEACRMLSNKVCALQSQLQQFQLEKKNNYNYDEQKAKNNNVPSNAEDEGISSSERSSSSEDCKSPNKVKDNDQETTIDDVIEELRIIVKDAEEEHRKEDLKKQGLYEASKSKYKERNSLSEEPRKDYKVIIEMF